MLARALGAFVGAAVVVLSSGAANVHEFSLYWGTGLAF
jgi:hypothetical protein